MGRGSGGHENRPVILVDSSVWIDFFLGQATPQVEVLDRLLAEERLAIGDLILAEVLQGFRSEREAGLARDTLAVFEPVELGGFDVAWKAAHNFRRLRALGITPRKTVDTLIATWCIASGCVLLHADRDFDPFAQHLGLQVVPLDP